MWSKSLLGLSLALLLSASLMLNLNYVLPVAVDVRLLTGLLLGFVLWGGAMILFYRKDSAWRTARNVLLVLVASCAINAAYML